MDTHSELSSTSLSNGDELIEQEGKRYSRIPVDEAFRIRFDVQLYYYHRVDDRVLRDFDTPESYRRKSSEDHTYANAAVMWWKDRSFYIEVAPDREEYIPNG